MLSDLVVHYTVHLRLIGLQPILTLDISGV
jgi:hypothetical protein